MKRLLLILMVVLLLSGCGVEEVPETTAAPVTTPTEATGYYDPNSAVQSQTGGAVFAYPLGQQDYELVLPMAEKLLLVRQDGQLTALKGERCIPAVTVQTNAQLSGKVSFDTATSGVSYYDEASGQVVLLDSRLMELSRINMPEDIQTEPAVDLSNKEIFYCQEGHVRALNIQNGVSRLVMSHRYAQMSIEGLLLDGQVLVLRTQDYDDLEKTLYVSASTGEILKETDACYTIQTNDDTYLLPVTDGDVLRWVFGNTDTEPAQLEISNKAYGVFDMTGVVSCNTEAGCAVLDYYDLETGLHSAAVTIPDVSKVCNITSDSRYIWLLGVHNGKTTLYRWDIVKSPVVDAQVYVGPFYTAQNPNVEELEKCKERADELGKQYGIRVNIWKDAINQTDSFAVITEHRPESIGQMLDELEVTLAQYPVNILQSAIRGGTLQISLVRSIDNGAVYAQFFSNGDAYILLSEDSQILWDFSRAFYYVLDSFVLGNSRDFDDWAQLNPKGFEYPYDYEGQFDEQSLSYLEGENRAFIDEIAMTYPHEDRCRVFLYAMQEDSASYFETDTMQLKLRTLCEGIREAFGLEKTKDILPWERYLKLEMDFSNF